MTPGRWRRALLVGLAVVIVAAGAAAVNLALLGAAGEDRLGRLRPIDAALEHTTAAPRAAPAPPAPDDGSRAHGRGRGGDDD